MLLAVPTVDALQKSGIAASSTSVQGPSLPPSDRILPPEYYKSVYTAAGFGTTEGPGAATNTGGRTPWDIGHNRPQPAVVRAYEEGKIRGNVLDAGCGMGENCMFLASKYGIKSVTGFDLSEVAVEIAAENALDIAKKQEEQSQLPFWTTPSFLAASCTDVADRHREKLLSGITNSARTRSSSDKLLFDVVIDSGLLHCLSKEDAREYVNQISKLLQPNTGKFYIGCFSTANPDPWDNPRRISEEYLRDDLFSNGELWEIVSCTDCWWARPPTRGSSKSGAFSLALWVEARCLAMDKN